MGRPARLCVSIPVRQIAGINSGYAFLVFATALFLMLDCLHASAQMVRVPAITSVAGTGSGGYVASQDGGVATSAQLYGPNGVAVDPSGNIYIADSANNRVRKIAATTGIITTVAGNGTQGYVTAQDGGPAASAELNHPSGVALDTAGNLYIADTANNRIRRIDALTQTITTIAGTGTAGYVAAQDNGLATKAELNGPTGIVVDRFNEVLVADTGNNRVRVIAAGIIQTFAGGGTGGYTVAQEGASATSATLSAPQGIAIDAANDTFIADKGNQRIRRVDIYTLAITTVAGNGIPGYSGDASSAVSAELDNPWGVAVDGSGNLYIADATNNRVRKVDGYTAKISTVVGTGATSTPGDGGAATSGDLDFPESLALDLAGNLYVADYLGARVRRVDLSLGGDDFPTTNVGDSSITVNVLLSTTQAEAISGFSVAPSIGGKQEFTVGTPTGCTVNPVQSVPAGTICIVPVTFTPGYPGTRNIPLLAATSLGTAHIGLSGFALGSQLRFTPGLITTVAGNGAVGYSGDGSSAKTARINGPESIVIDSAGNLYFADGFNNRVRKVTASTGVISTFAGNGTTVYSGDGGLATAAGISGTGALALDSAGNLYIADGNNYIRLVSASTGIITTIAGNGTQNFGGEGGPATGTGFARIGGMAISPAGDLYVSDELDDCVRKIAAGTGVITTVAGYNGNFGFGGDGGQAIYAQLGAPEGLAFDSLGNLYITDSSNSSIREVSRATAIINTIAGTPPNPGTGGDGGYSISAQLNQPNAIALDAAGNVYIADSYNYRIRKAEAGSGLMSTIAGTGTSGYVAAQEGGPATSAQMSYPTGIASDAAGNLYISDFYNYRIRKIDTSPVTLTFSSTAVGTVSSDGAKAESIASIGNTGLYFDYAGSGYNPSTAAGFALDMGPATTCPIASTTSGAGSLSPGYSCQYSYAFYPVSAGSISSTATVNTKTLNVDNTASSWLLTGAATPGSQTITFPALTTPVTYYSGQGAILQASSSASLPIAYTVTGPATVNGSILTFTGTGTVVVTANQAGTADYMAATPVSQTIHVLLPPAITWNPSTHLEYTGAPLTAAVLDASTAPAGTFTYTATLGFGSPVAVSASTALYVPGNYTLTANFTPTDNSTYAPVSSTVAFTVQNQNIFVANTSNVASFYNSALSVGPHAAGGGLGAAIDASGNVWSIDSSGSSVSKISDSNVLQTSYSGGGISAAKALAIDGAGKIWLVNNGGTVTALTNSGAAVFSNAIAAAGNINVPTSLQIDAAGSVWIANFGNGTVTEVIGIAAPVVTPAVTAVANSSMGVRP